MHNSQFTIHNTAVRRILLSMMTFLCVGLLFAQDFSDDDFFFTDDDGIIEMEEVAAPKSDLARGVLFETGSVKIGGTFDLSLTTLTTFSKDKVFKAFATINTSFFI